MRTRSAAAAEAADGHSAVQPSQFVPASRTKPSHTRLIRSLAIADFVTLINAACGVCSIFFCLNFLENQHANTYIAGAFILLPLALVADIADGYIARVTGRSSVYGADLDSLADVVSFSVAPAVLAFTLGLRGFWDCVILSLFVCCGIGRLARYNVTAMTISAGTGKVKYYEGFPVPTSLALVMILGVCYYFGAVLERIPFGFYEITLFGSYLGRFRPFSIIFGIFGALMVSEVRVPKP